MAQTHPRIWRQQSFAAKTETTNGTAIALATADTAYNAADVEIEAEDNAIKRQGQNTPSKQKTIPGAKSATVSARIEVANDAEASNLPKWFGTLLPACGFTISSSTATLAIGSTSLTTVTFARWIDGLRRSAAGCMFAAEFTYEMGQIPQMALTGMGIWQAPTDEANPTFTVPGGDPPICTAMTATLGGTSYVIQRAVVRTGAQVILRQNVNSASGYVSAYITDSDVQVDVQLEESLLATQDWYAGFENKTSYAGSIAVGSGTNGIVTTAAPYLQLANRPKQVNVDGLACLNLTFDAIRNSANGGDELTIALT